MMDRLALVELLERLIRDNSPLVGEQQVRLRMPDGIQMMVSMTAQKDPASGMTCIMGNLETENTEGFALVGTFSNVSKFTSKDWVAVARTMLKQLLDFRNEKNAHPIHVRGSVPRPTSELN